MAHIINFLKYHAYEIQVSREHALHCSKFHLRSGKRSGLRKIYFGKMKAEHF